MAGVAKNLDGFAIRIGGYYDYAHVLVRIPARVAVCESVGKLKANTSAHIDESRDAGKKFHWLLGKYPSSVHFEESQILSNVFMQVNPRSKTILLDKANCHTQLGMLDKALLEMDKAQSRLKSSTVS